VLRLRLLHRLGYIGYTLTKYRLGEFLPATRWLYPIKFLTHLNPGAYKTSTSPRGERFRKALEDLGPIFIKFGQMLSTRRDLIPEDIARELAKLQDKVPPFKSQSVKAIVERTYQQKFDQLFKEFSLQPLASASIAQVHAAKLHDGKDAVVKILRPGVENIIRRDVALMKMVARILEKYWPRARRLRPIEVVAEFDYCLHSEVNLLLEAANASQLKRNATGSVLLHIPEIYWPYAKPNIIVMERVYGVPISDLPTLKNLGVDLKLLANMGVEIFFTQLFRDNFFHADMHPGNIFVDVRDPKNPRYLAVDFGIVGTLDDQDKQYIAENLHAFFKRDYKRIAQLHVESGWVDPKTNVMQFEAAIRMVSEPVFERPLKDISFGSLLINLFATARRFNMEVQPQLVLLQKTLLNIEGLGRDLYPDLNLWETAKPFLEKWVREQKGVVGLKKNFQKNAHYWTEKLPELPKLASELLETLEQHARKQTQLFYLLAQNNKKKSDVWLSVGFTLLIFSLLEYALSQPMLAMNIPLVSAITGGVGAIMMLASKLK